MMHHPPPPAPMMQTRSGQSEGGRQQDQLPPRVSPFFSPPCHDFQGLVLRRLGELGKLSRVASCYDVISPNLKRHSSWPLPDRRPSGRSWTPELLARAGPLKLCESWKKVSWNFISESFFRLQGLLDLLHFLGHLDEADVRVCSDSQP